jgi:hypothetical protein
METHFASCDQATESDNTTYWYDTACGLRDCESDMSDKVDDVTCKNCLKVLNKKGESKPKKEKVYPSIF